MLLMVEKGIRRGKCHAMHRHAKANDKYIKYYDENEESAFLEYLNANNLYDLATSELLPVYGSDWIKDLSKIDEYFIRNYDKDGDKGYILEIDVKCTKNLHALNSDLLFLPE